LKKAKAEQSKIRLVLRGGEILIGTIAWVSPYEIKVEFPSGGNVIAFRHAAYDFAPLSTSAETDEDGEKNKPKEETQRAQKEEEKIYHQVGITKEQAAQGVRASIPTVDGKKIVIRLPAGVSDGKRFKIKDSNLYVVVSVEETAGNG